MHKDLVAQNFIDKDLAQKKLNDIIENYFQKTCLTQKELAVKKQSILKNIQIYTCRLLEENEKLNLISPSALTSLWQRHIIDGAQIASLIKESDNIIDFGSGNGIPGILLSIITDNFTLLLDKSFKKINFLNNICRDMLLPCQALCCDFSLLPTYGNKKHLLRGLPIGKKMLKKFANGRNVIVARAFKDLTAICDIAEFLNIPDNVIIALKGKSYGDEIEELNKNYSYDLLIMPSITGEGVVIKLKNVKSLKVKILRFK